jgi:hypothetical protein
VLLCPPGRAPSHCRARKALKMWHTHSCCPTNHARHVRLCPIIAGHSPSPAQRLSENVTRIHSSIVPSKRAHGSLGTRHVHGHVTSKRAQRRDTRFQDREPDVVVPTYSLVWGVYQTAATCHSPPRLLRTMCVGTTSSTRGLRAQTGWRALKPKKLAASTPFCAYSPVCRPERTSCAPARGGW